MALRAEAEPRIEVHKFHTGAVAGTASLALLVQAFLPLHVRAADLVELPLLVVLYFGLSRRNAVTGLLLGMVVGLAQDALGGLQVGLNGIAKTLVGFLASTLGGRIDVDHPVSRVVLAFLFFHFHQGVIGIIKRLLLAEPEAIFSPRLLLASAVNAALALVLFALLDRLRKKV